ncbi:MAG: MerR family transcriptional regulator [Dermatophilaceae bacterium]
MLTIGQLAGAAGVTVRAVRHYHATGLLPGPERDGSGYRRYPAAAVVELVKIRTLADAGVPLSRVHELLVADDAELAAAVAEIDRRLRAEVRERQEHRRRIARLAAGDSLALPPEAVAYLDKLRAFGFQERIVEIERDSWILIAAQMPEAVPAMMAIKHTMLEHEVVRGMYLEVGTFIDIEPDDAALPAFADHVVELVEAMYAAAEEEVSDEARALEVEHPVSDELVALLDAIFLESFPAAPRLLELLEERGLTGWTNIRRIETAP